MYVVFREEVYERELDLSDVISGFIRRETKVTDMLLSHCVVVRRPSPDAEKTPLSCSWTSFSASRTVLNNLLHIGLGPRCHQHPPVTESHVKMEMSGSLFGVEQCSWQTPGLSANTKGRCHKEQH